MLRRASHLKVCDLKGKVSSMVPEQSEYSSFGRSTRLLLHPKDIPDLQFTTKTENMGEILPKPMKSQDKIKETVNNIEIIEKVSEIPLKSEVAVSNVGKDFIVGYAEPLKKEGTTQPVTAGDGGKDNVHEEPTWLQNPVDCVSK